MEDGALYFEFSDGNRIAMHRSLYLDDSLIGAKEYNAVSPFYKKGEVVEMNQLFFECKEKTYVDIPTGTGSFNRAPVGGYQPPVDKGVNQRFWLQIDNLITYKVRIKRAPYRTFVQRLMSDSRIRTLRNVFYKPTLNNKDGEWVDLLMIGFNAANGFLSKDFLDGVDRTWNLGESAVIGLSNIKAVSYWGKPDGLYLGKALVHDIDEGDGRLNDDIRLRECDNLYFPIRSKWRGPDFRNGYDYDEWERVVDIQRVDMDNPSNTFPHTFNDIKITLTPGHDYQAEHINTKDTLTWVNGLFVNTSKESDSVMYIKNGMNFVNFQYSSIAGMEPLPTDHEGTMTAAYVVPRERKIMTPDFDIRILKWTGVGMSDWIPGFSPVFADYNYLSKQYDYPVIISYLESISFPRDIDENHIIMCHGGILPRHSYNIVKEKEGVNRVVFKMDRIKLDELCYNAIREFGRDGMIHWHVGSVLPTERDFHLIQFTSRTRRKIHLDRSQVNHVNHPYPYFATFNKFKVGDLVLLDGFFDRYLLHNKNMIRFPWTDYSARWVGKNYLDATNLERISFSEIG